MLLEIINLFLNLIKKFFYFKNSNRSKVDINTCINLNINK